MQTSLQEPIKIGMMVFPGQIASTLPLEHTRVNAHITGLISNVTVNQSFFNPFTMPIELEYLFPLPENAALIDFSLRIGNRVVHADLHELEQAQKAYDQAREDGRQAAKLDQRRPNLFALQIANVLPAHPIQVSVSYEHQMSINVDELEFIFPMGITPKYHSQLQDDETKGVDSPVASPAERIGEVEIDVVASLGSNIGEPTSPSHPLRTENLGVGQYTIKLERNTIPDHDFVLRFPLIQDSIEPLVWCTQDDSSEYALISWLPATIEPSQDLIQPREFVFVLDRSGSMSGDPIRQARNAMRACLRILEPKDTFRILLFDDRLEWYRSDAIQVGQKAIDQADEFLSLIEGRGGTEIVQAIEATLDLPVDSERLRYILFLTDGAVSAEESAFQSIRKKLNQSRIFTFGIGSSVNRALLSKMAQLGRGSAEFLQLNEDIEGTILRFQDKVAFPVLTNIQLDWSGCQAWDVFPSTLPDLYVGQSLQMVTRLKRSMTGETSGLRVAGIRGQERVAIDIKLPESVADMPEVKRAWARARIDDLLEQSASGQSLPHKIRQEVIGLALENRLVTPFTAFVALDPEVVNPQGEMLAVAVAQPLPKGLNIASFIPSAPVQFSQASMAMPSIPQFLKKRALQDTMTRESTIDDGAYQQSLSPSTNAIHSTDDPKVSTVGAGIPSMQTISTGAVGIDSMETLRWLARTQDLDGSWSKDVEFTAAALLAFVRQGNTTRKGFYRKQVGRAAQWLLQATCNGSPAYFRAFALYELAGEDPKLAFIQQIKTTIQQIPPATTPLEHIVQNRINHPEAPNQEPGKITDLESLRIASILKLELAVPDELLKNDPHNLARIWMAGLLKIS